MADLTLSYILSLALVDAINPCALAVILMILMNMLLQDPTNKKRVLYGGLAFSSAVFILYFIYGILMVTFFAGAIPATGNIANYIFKGFGIITIILGLLNLRDFLDYKPGSTMTEMPLSLRPKLKSLINKVTTIKGAFIAGLLVTLFLLPCTIGPYIIASGKLSAMEIVNTIPWLVFYNLVFLLPMIGITIVIFLGVTTVDKISGWKEKNIRFLHLFEAVILIILGILMLTGII